MSKRATFYIYSPANIKISSFTTLHRHINILVNEIMEGRVSFAYEALDRFPRSLVEVLRHDITHLDLTANNIRNFDFIRGFKGLKSLIIDLNVRVDMNSFPPVDSLELFYANKCKIEFPRSFVFRVSVVFKSLKYFSMMYNPALKRIHESEALARDHRMRMYAIFMLPNLIHYNDKKITDDEREHSKAYHVYLGPIDCRLWNFTTLPDTDDIRAILPVHIRKKTAHLRGMEWQDDEDMLEDALKSVSISDYFTRRQVDSISINSFTSSDNTATSDGSPTSSVITDEGVGSLAPSEQSENFLWMNGSADLFLDLNKKMFSKSFAA